MVAVAQLVRALVCGTGGRGFKSPQPPHELKKNLNLLFLKLGFDSIYYLNPVKALATYLFL